MFDNFDYSNFKKMPPPKDGSLRSLSEIKDLQKIPIDKDFINKRDDIYGSFKELADNKNINIDKKEVDKLADGSASIILKLKKYYNRPRPKDQAKQYGIDLENVELASMKTPSYPSGHSVQGTLIGKVLGDKHPKAKSAFAKTGENISYSRRVARAHYKSDSKMGEKLGNSMYKHIKNKL